MQVHRTEISATVNKSETVKEMHAVVRAQVDDDETMREAGRIIRHAGWSWKPARPFAERFPATDLGTTKLTNAKKAVRAYLAGRPLPEFPKPAPSPAPKARKPKASAVTVRATKTTAELAEIADGLTAEIGSLDERKAMLDPTRDEIEMNVTERKLENLRGRRKAVRTAKPQSVATAE